MRLRNCPNCGLPSWDKNRSMWSCGTPKHLPQKYIWVKTWYNKFVPWDSGYYVQSIGLGDFQSEYCRDLTFAKKVHNANGFIKKELEKNKNEKA